MRSSKRSLPTAVTLATLILVCPAHPAFAGGAEKTPPASRPTLGRAKKLVTNDDLPNWGMPPQSNATTPPAPLNAEANLPLAPKGTAAANAPYVPEQDPYWYAKRTQSLEADLQSVDSKVEQLRRFRITGTGLPTGLILDAPCEGITTDNEIAQLNLRRRQIAQELDQLGDTARRNHLPPRLFRDAAEIVQAHEAQVSLTAEEEQAALQQRMQGLRDGLAQIQGLVADLQAEAAARGMTLLFPTGNGGSMTTDMLERLARQANALRSSISSIEDDARRAGLAPGLLR